MEHRENFVLNLYRRLERKEITQAEYNKEIGYWTFQNQFDDTRYIPMPTIPPVMKEYYDLEAAEKKNLSREFWQQPDVVNYLDMKTKTKAQNDEHARTLKELLRLLPEEDIENRTKVEERAKDFKRQQAEDPNRR